MIPDVHPRTAIAQAMAAETPTLGLMSMSAADFVVRLSWKRYYAKKHKLAKMRES